MHTPAYAKAASAGGPAYAETASAGRPDRVYRHTTSIKDKASASAPAYIFKTCFLNFVLSLYSLCLLHFCPAEAAEFICVNMRDPTSPRLCRTTDTSGQAGLRETSY